MILQIARLLIKLLNNILNRITNAGDKNWPTSQKKILFFVLMRTRQCFFSEFCSYSSIMTSPCPLLKGGEMKGVGCFWFLLWFPLFAHPCGSILIGKAMSFITKFGKEAISMIVGEGGLKYIASSFSLLRGGDVEGVNRF